MNNNDKFMSTLVDYLEVNHSINEHRIRDVSQEDMMAFLNGLQIPFEEITSEVIAEFPEIDFSEVRSYPDLKSILVDHGLLDLWI